MAKIRLDQSNFPFVVMTMPGEKPQEEILIQVYRSLKNLLERKVPFALIFDTSQADFIAKEMVEYHRKWLNENRSVAKNILLGTAFFVDSASLRLLLKANNFFKPNAIPETIQATYEESYLWVDKQIERKEKKMSKVL